MRSIIFIIIVFLFSACGADKSEGVKELEAQKIKIVPISYAKHFSIADNGTYKVLTVLPSVGKAQSYVLYKKGSSKPVVNEQDVVFIETPVQTTACLSSLYVGYLDRIGECNGIVGVDNADYISNKIVTQRVKNGAAKELAKADKLNEEITIALHPDLILTYGSGSGGNEANNKISNAGIPIVYCIDNRETSPLGRAEWVKFIACFYNQEQLADSLFKETEEKYNLLKLMASQTAELPTVFTETKLSDAWYVPGGKSFMATLIKDAHANYCWANDSSEASLPLSFEQVYKTSIHADYWINLGFCSTKKDLLDLDARYRNFKAYKTGNVYNYNAKLTPAGGNEFWETGLIMPDLILMDMIKMFHPQLYPDKPFSYYRKLDE